MPLRLMSSGDNVLNRLINSTGWHGGLLIGVAVLIPFMLVVGLGIHSYRALEERHKNELFDKATTEARLLQNLLSSQVDTLGLSHQTAVRNAILDDRYGELSSVVTNNPRIELVSVFTDEGILYPDSGLALTFSDKTLLDDVKTEMTSAHDRLQRRSANQTRDIWFALTTSIGPAYLYCWSGQPGMTLCVLSKATVVNDWVWDNDELMALRHDFIIDDSFSQQEAAPETLLNVQYSFNKLGLIMTPQFKTAPRETASARWLFLAMVLPLLGLSCAVSYLVYRHYKVQVSRAETLLSCTQDIAHELRTPLGNINLYVGLMLRSEVPSDKERYQLIIDNEMLRISQIIDNATALMRGTPVDPWEYLSPTAHLQSLYQQYQLRLTSTGCQLSVKSTLNEHYWYPKHAVELVLLNLLDNARKYAPGHLVTLSAELVGNELRFSVNNHRQQSVESLHAIAPSGLGLGLQTCQRLAAQFGGRLESDITDSGRNYALYLTILQRDPPC